MASTTGIEEAEVPFRGTFEVHIFVGPINAPQETVERFQQVCESAHNKMKGLYLVLDFSHIGLAGVMQSSRYVTGSMADVRRVCKEDSDWLATHGFEVLREKIESVAGITEGVPDTKEDYERLIAAYPKAAPNLYFEFHIQMEHHDKGGFHTQEDEKLREKSKELSAKLGVPVPMSFNQFRPAQRFLNTRTYNLGKTESYALVDQVTQAITDLGLNPVKVIREFIVSDTNKALDNGWLEPLPVH
eukprot:TRINITY_DN5833_c1_g1_i1.p1 TRINITY_DN5833_c1_g1~~TRINITY_DN5833_c1_g1_i1.p1  ORF type:complete len:244 (-),score=41.99 TRINITY_DN5833_c1_g1_i1:124-855(-)